MNNRPTILHLPGHLPYPVTISSLLVKPDSPIKKHDGLLVYKFFAYESEEQDDHEEQPVRKERVEQFDSPWEGILTEWLVKEGTVVNSSNEPIVSVIEPCLHEISFKDICAICGTDLSVRDYTGDVSTQPNISMSHDNFDVKVTYDEAARIEKQTLKRLLTSRKLSLIVDLDQTIIHATVDPTVGEWMQQPDNPNYNAVKDVQPFQLEEGGQLGPCWYFIKVRPGLAEFLENVSKLYELHVYTMGTRAYANAVAKIVDPKGKYFGDRVLSRDESGSIIFVKMELMTGMARKSIERLFPVDQSMVAVIDDRGDVWGWQSNLVKVMPYDFFVGIGDINSSFLPKQFTPPPTPPPRFPPPKPPTPAAEDPSKLEVPATESVTSDTPTIDSLVAITQADDPDLIRAQTSEQNAVLEAQQVERPLAAAQHALDIKVEELAASSSESESEDEELYGDKSSSHKSTPPPSPHKQSLLRDDDDELKRLEGVLENVWRNFYDAYRKSLEGMQREKQLVRLEGRGRSSTETGKVPDIRDIMSEMRRHVLEGVTLVFSGVIPLNVNWQTHDYTQLARQFGADVVNELSSSVTHIVAKNTAKVKDAMHRYPRSKIVHLNWLLMSASSWRRLDESNYLLDEPHSDAFSPPNGLDPLDTQAFLSSDEDDEDEALSLPSAGVANVRGETPESENDEEDVDIGEIDWGDAEDWGDADKEVNEFLAELGEDAALTTDESDNESVASNTSESRGRKRKRKHDSSREVSDADDSDTESPSNDDRLRSRLAKRIHTAHARKSALSKTMVVASGSKPSSAAASPNGSSHGPSPVDAPASANGSAVDRESADDGDAEEDSDLDDWANEFEKELV